MICSIFGYVPTSNVFTVRINNSVEKDVTNFHSNPGNCSLAFLHTTIFVLLLSKSSIE